jgi:hypothetical protein
MEVIHLMVYHNITLIRVFSFLYFSTCSQFEDFVVFSVRTQDMADTETKSVGELKKNLILLEVLER